MDRKIIFIYVTCPDEKLAKSIGRKLVEEKLVACANIIPGMTSIYQWQGKLEESSEIVLLLKTREELFNKVAMRIKQLHSYETPCIVALSVIDCEKSFSSWLNSSTI